MLPGTKDRYALRFEFDRNSLYSQNVHDDIINDNIYSTVTTTADITRYGLNGLVSYRIPSRRTSLEFDLGAGFSLVDVGGSRKEIESMYFGIRRKQTIEKILQSKMEASLLLGATYNYKKIGVGLRYELGWGYLKMDDLKAHTNRVSLVLMIGF